MASDYSSLLKQGLGIMQKAEALLRELHTAPRQIRYKRRTDLVTETDLAVEAFLQDALAPLVPGACFLAEESATSLHLPDCCWIIDPVDGTTNYAHGLPVCGISVAYHEGGDVVLGMVAAPLLGECWYASKGGGAFCNGRPIRVSETESLEKALVATGFPYEYEDGSLEHVLSRLRVFLPAVQDIRRCGAASIDLSWVGGGRFDGFYETELKPWDVAGATCIIREAGGTVTHFDGTPFTFCAGGRNDVLASNSALHGEMMRLLQAAGS